MPFQKKKCSLKQCLSHDGGLCLNNLPNMLSTLIPDSIKCPLFDDDFAKTLKEYMNQGGTIGALAVLNGRKLKEANEGRPRKVRADKGVKRGKVVGGKKRGRKKKEENSLQDIM